MQQIKNAAVPYNTVGLLEVTWIPLKGPEEIDENLEGNSIGATSNEDEYVNIEIDEVCLFEDMVNFGSLKTLQY